MSSSIKTEPESDPPDADQSLPPELDENTAIVWPTDPEMDSQNGEELSSDGKPSTSDDQRYSFWFGNRVDTDEESVEDEQEESEGFSEWKVKAVEDVKPLKKSRQKSEDDDDPDWTEENDGIITPGKKRKKYAYQSDTPKQYSRFRFQWTEEFKWLQYNATAKVMFCEFCQIAGKTGKFATTGENEFDKVILTAHNFSKEHIEAECEVKMSQSDNSNDASLLAPQSEEFLDEEMGGDSQNMTHSESALLVALRTAYYAAQNQGDKSPSHVYQSMMALQDSCNVIGAKELRLKKQPEKMLVLKQCDDLKSPEEEYEFGDNESLAEMHDVLARIVQEDMYTKISQSDFVTVIIQEKPDIDLQALQKQLVIHARYTHQGSLCIGFLGTVIVMEDKPDDAVKEIMQVLQDCDISMQQVVAIQILCQKKNGKSVVSSSLFHWQLAERLTKDRDMIVLITAHTHPPWNMCVSIAAQNLEEGTKFQHMLGRLVIYLQSIPSKVEASDTLKDLVRDPLCQWDGLQMPPWLMVYKIAKVISTTWVTLIEILETETTSSQNGSSQAQQFLDELQKYQFLAFIHLLLDLVTIVKEVERHLNEMTPNEACQHAWDSLKDLQDNHGDHEKQFLKELDLEKKMFCNHHIYFSEKQDEGANQMRANFINRVGEQISSRCCVRKNDAVRRLFHIFNPRVLSSMSSIEMGEFGRDELQALVTRFLEASADKDFFPEYQEMKMALYQHLKTDSLKTISEKMNSGKPVQRMNPISIASQRCPNIVRLLRCAVTIPGVCHHADREVLQVLKKAQGFMEKHGTEANTLSRMVIANHGVNLNEFDFTNALQEWNTL